MEKYVGHPAFLLGAFKIEKLPDEVLFEKTVMPQQKREASSKYGMKLLCCNANSSYIKCPSGVLIQK